MDDSPPPTSHVLRPHHIGLLAALTLTFKEIESKDLPSPFVLHVIRVLLNEVSEVTQPKSCQELFQELSLGPKADVEGPRRLLGALRTVHIELSTAERLANFFGSVPALFVEKTDDEEPPPFMRRSIFGYFCRRCFVSFLKLSFSGVVKLQKDYQAWCLWDSQAGYEYVEKDHLNNADLLIFKTRADKKSWAQPESYEIWEKGQATGDENIAIENLRRFFEQHFHENNDSGYRQHALLNLVRMHYMRNEFTAARTLLSEAITVARTSGDRLTLQHCISMSHRLPPLGHARPFLNEIQPDLDPLEILFDVKKLMQVQNEQPLSASFERIVQAVGLFDHWVDVHLATNADAEQWAQHAVQAIVWSAAGCDRLAAIEENIVTAFTKIGGDDHNRFVTTLNRAYKWARQGKYEESINILLDPDVWRGITLNDYVAWANQIWHIIVLRASRRGQDRLYREFLLPRRPPGAFNPKEYFFDTTSSSPSSLIRDPLYEVMELQRCDQATTGIDKLLTALWHSEFQGRLVMYRTAIILLADIGLEFGMTKRCREILEEIMPQIINGDDLEQRAFACYTLAKCIIAAGDSTTEALLEALPYLITSEADLNVIQMIPSLAHVQYLLTVVYHNLGMEIERDEIVNRHFATEEKREALEAVVVDEEISQILEVVGQVGASLASR